MGHAPVAMADVHSLSSSSSGSLPATSTKYSVASESMRGFANRCAAMSNTSCKEASRAMAVSRASDHASKRMRISSRRASISPGAGGALPAGTYSAGGAHVSSASSGGASAPSTRKDPASAKEASSAANESASITNRLSARGTLRGPNTSMRSRSSRES
ncbi:hypothetical protein C1878_07645 [Gordonibacter sp. 28C]|uniref:hypothetical protein n=1 Tax=Gordonibacter sp. 28C TaxID=2078569 RepID=UPI000DF7E599|nr:hypothetical protein [Gordonibacter sp. 28C]RDB62204.1 hypothetical protein C1878_07645 [Gordonibacter sp. 28C]